MTPRFSIITPCLNGARFVRDALHSVQAQGRLDVEHLVVDGGSSDGTVQLLAADPRVTLLHAPGSSIYEALNAGLARARGRIIGLLNVDDHYGAGAFDAVDACWRAAGTAALCGRAALRAEGPAACTAAGLRQGGELLCRVILGDPCINAWFFDATTVATLGGFDPRYRVAGDREFLLRLVLAGLPVRELPRTVYGYRAHAGSVTFAGSAALWRRTLDEHNQMTGELLARPGLAPPARALLRRARTRDNLAGARFAIRSGDVSGFLRHVRAGMRHDAAWPLRFAARLWRESHRALGTAAP